MKRKPGKPKSARLRKDLAELIRWERVSRLATVSERGMPHVVPVCHALAGDKLLIGAGNDARKVLNLKANPRLAVTVDLYADDWKNL